jgi:hypothetical protein
METTSGKEALIVLRRLIAYSEKIFQLSKDIVTQVSDRKVTTSARTMRKTPKSRTTYQFGSRP